LFKKRFFQTCTLSKSARKIQLQITKPTTTKSSKELSEKLNFLN